jgi:hypothetical protein
MAVYSNALIVAFVRHCTGIFSRSQQGYSGYNKQYGQFGYG